MRKHANILLTTSTVTLIILITLSWLLKTDNTSCENDITEQSLIEEQVEHRPLKYILEWAPLNKYKEEQDLFVLNHCKIVDCFATSNRRALRYITDYDAIIFKGPSLSLQQRTNTTINLPIVRSGHQKYIYWNIESAYNYPLCNPIYDGFFNWTMTYKLNSDVPLWYITVRNKQGDIIGPNKFMHWINTDSMLPVTDDVKEMLMWKREAAILVTSHCTTVSGRELFVRSLGKQLYQYGISIDILGSCGMSSCGEYNDCLDKVKEYIFYLALENSDCDDYVTEKLLWAIDGYAVPVVFGTANYSRFMPDGMYLHGSHETVDQLAKQMANIVQNKDLHYSYFKWRNHYRIHRSDDEPDSNSYCNLCEKLHDENFMNRRSVIKSFRDWWNVPGLCKDGQIVDFAL